jgi:CBS domain-containing protein
MADEGGPVGPSTGGAPTLATATAAGLDVNAAFRGKVAGAVIYVSGAILVLLAVVVGYVARTHYLQTTDLAAATALVEKFLFALLPMIGTWVGTVLAFYFTNDSFQTASNQTRLTLSDAREARLRQISVREAMVPISKVQAIEADEAEWPNVYFDTDVIDLINKKFSRVPFLSKGRGRVLGIVHDAIVKAYAWQNGVPPQGGTKTKTLKDFLGNADVRDVFEHSLAFVGPGATLADVKRAMEVVSARGHTCRDVFVTEDGTPTGKPLGLITNIDLEKFSSYG